MHELIREYIECVIESSVEKMSRQKGVKLMRVGGLSPVKQTNTSAPEKYGVWAFVWPYFDLFFLSSTNHRGITTQPKNSDKEPVTRITQFKKEGFRTFFHTGVLYTRFDVPGGIDYDKDWCKTTGTDLADYLSKYHSQLMKDYRSSLNRVDPNGYSYRVERSTPEKFFSRDMWEVFVPNPGKK